MFLVIDGMDGAGKSTLVDMVSQYLQEDLQIKNICLDHFPKRTHTVQAFLSNEPGVSPLEFEMESFMQKYHYSFVIDSFAKCRDNALLVDRWIPSGVVYGIYNFMSKLNRDKNGAEAFFEKLNSIVSPPDFGWVLVCNPETSARRLDGRPIKEVYEDFRSLRTVHDLFYEFCHRHHDYKLIDTTDLTPQQTFEEVKSDLNNLFKL